MVQDFTHRAYLWSLTATRVQPQALNISLWITQSLLCVLYIGTAFWKVLTPIPALAEMIPWVGEHSPALLYTTSLVDLCGGIGILLPSVMRVRPQLVVWAACKCVAL